LPYCTFHAYARRNGFNYRHWRFAHRKYGHWITLPGVPENVGKSDYRLDALCTKCGTVHSVTLINLRTGMSTMCLDCSRKNRTFRSIKCVTDGQMFSSVKALADFLETPSRYLTIRQKLFQDGVFEYEGKTYEFIDRVCTINNDAGIVTPNKSSANQIVNT
jgi:hypothetical protein